MSNLMVVIGSVSAAEYDPIRHNLVRTRKKPKVRRVLPTAFEDLSHRTATEAAYVSYQTDQDVDELAGEVLNNHLAAILGHPANDVICLVLSEAAYEHLSEGGQGERILINSPDDFFPNLREVWVIHSDWRERRF